MVRPEWIEVGRVSRPHGVRGEVRVTSDTDNPERFAPGSVVYARPSRAGVVGARSAEQARLTVSSIRGDAAFPIVAFNEVGDRDGAEALRGHVLEVRSDELPELGDDEFYPFDLEGLAVRDDQGAPAGRVSDVVESPAHSLLVIALDCGRQVMVPFVAEAVPLVKPDEGYLVVARRFLDQGERTGA